ncbi:HAD family hydrolase [Butyricicoccus pullicaecorum]|uniref:HAD family hydrolase n=1 Tax=Butyricicoccus pullicaecorum TaxID=501571 RepID=UPI00352223DF
MLDTVQFDMGGTLEDIWYNEETAERAARGLLDLLEQHRLTVSCGQSVFWEQVQQGVSRYKAWSEGAALEKKPEEIWSMYYLASLGLPDEKVGEIAEELADFWEVTYYHRELRPGVRETLEELKTRGYKLGVISNTASLYSVFNVLEHYGIRDYFQDVTLSSVTGYRKPHPGIFQISLRQMQSKPENCVYVGDTRSRDIMGAKRAGFGLAVQIGSALTEQKDALTDPCWQPDARITSIPELLDVLTARDDAL